MLRAPMSEMLASIREVGDRTEVQLLEHGQQRPPNHVKAFFDVGPQQTLFRALRLRFWQGQPLFLVETFLPEWIGARISEAALRNQAFYTLLSGMGVTFAAGEQVIGATIATAAAATWLGTELGAPLLRVRRATRDADSQPVQFVEFLASPFTYEIRTKLETDDLR